jgi:hypothetical protein
MTSHQASVLAVVIVASVVAGFAAGCACGAYAMKGEFPARLHEIAVG